MKWDWPPPPHEWTMSPFLTYESYPNKGYVSIEKWSYIFVSGTGSAQTESEEKATFTY